MKKAVIIHTAAHRELSKFSDSVQEKFGGFFLLLIEDGRLCFPDAKKIENNLFEIRIKEMGEYRGILCILTQRFNCNSSFFSKKNNKNTFDKYQIGTQKNKRL